MQVIIDGIEYVPKCEVSPPTDERLQECLRHLIEIQYFHECSHKHRAWAWDALYALSPELARLVSDNPEAVFDFVRGGFDVRLEKCKRK